MTKQLLCVSAGMLLFGVSMAEAQVTTSSINGTITDSKTKETLIGASVVVRHMPTGTVYGAATNAKGNFAIQGLRPGGPYTVEVSYVGYKTVKIQNLSLSLGEAETLNVKLTDDNQLSEVLVTGKKTSSLNATRTGSATSFSRAAMDRVPTVSRSISDIARLTPQANGTGSFAGANSRYNSFQIDGAVNNDVFGLGQSGKNAISLEAIDALQVVIAPFDVRQSGFTGAGMNAITKSGTNTFHGSAYDYYYNQDFYGTTAGKDVKERKKLNDQYENTVGFTVGGPIVKDKLFFFANGEYIKKLTPATFIPGDGLSKIKKEEADKVEKKLKDLGYDAGGYLGHNIPEETYKALFRLDWNINAANHLTVRYSHIYDDQFNFSNSPTQLLFRNFGYGKRSITNTIVSELNTRFSNSLSNELRVSYSGIRDNRTFSGKPFPAVQIDLAGGSRIRAGVDANTPLNELGQDIFSLTNNLTWTKGNHTFTLGTHNELFKMRNLFVPNAYGYYEYRNRKFKDANGKEVSVLGLDDFLNIGTAQEVGPSLYRQMRVNTNVTGDARWASEFWAGQVSLYAQDDWKASDKLRLTYGLRVDAPFFIDTPTENPAFNNSQIAKDYGVTNNYLPKITPLFSPRIGFRYNVDDERLYVVRGGTGIFTGRVPFVWISNSFSNSGVEFASTERRGKDVSDNVRFTPDPMNAVGDKNFVAGSSLINLAARDFKYPQVWRSTLAFEAMLPGGIKATLEGMFTKNLNNVRYRNYALVKAGEKDYGNGEVRPIYKQRPDARLYSSVIALENTDKGYSYNFTASLSKTFAFGLDASVSYTYGMTRGSNDGASSIAKSNWEYNYSNDINADEIGYSSNDLRHRLLAQLNYRVEYGKNFATTIGIVYNGQSGDRYSIIANNDLNADGSRNDLSYIPRTATTVKGSAISYEDFLSQNPDIARFAGRITERNGFVTPFFHRFDVHFAQDFFVNVGGRRHTLQLNADVINFGNLLNRAWGMNPYILYSSISPITEKADGTYEFNLRTEKPWSYSDISSRWRAQVGIKYIF